MADPDCSGCTNPQNLNRYAYVLNNPVTLTDPLGLYCVQGECCPSVDGTIDCSGGGASGGGNGEGGGPCVEVISAFHRGRPEVDCGTGPGGGGGGGNGPAQRAKKYFDKNKNCQDFILQTIHNIYQNMDDGGPLTTAQKQNDTTQAFDLNFDAMEV